MNKKLYVILSVDWEKDHGKYRFNKDNVDYGKYGFDLDNVDYGGILVGTGSLENILDDFGIPCTWFVETAKDYPELDIPKQFPESILELKNRKNDEIGTHLHWGLYNHKKKCWKYPTHDTEWINGQIQYAKEEAADFKINPTSFRGGAFLYVPHLPELLQHNGYLIDSTFEWEPSTRLINSPKIEYMSRLMGTPPSPYFANLIDFRKTGSSSILEFPVHLWLPRVLKRRRIADLLSLRFKYLMHGITTLYLHIDELTDYTTGPNEMTKINNNIIDNLKHFLDELSSNENVEFVTFNDALKLINENNFKF